MIRFALVSSCAMALLAGCATVRTTPYLQRTTSSDDAISGLTYRLPMVQYDLTIVRTLAECPGGVVDGKPTSLKFSTDIVNERNYVPGEAYTLDPRLIGFLKTSSLEVNYFPNGTLKSIGVAAEDRTGQVVENAAKLAAAGLLLGTGVPPVAVAAAASATALTSPQASALVNKSMTLALKPAAPLQIVCTEPAAKDLQALAQADKDIKSQTKALVVANDAMKYLAEEIALKLKDPTTSAVRDQWSQLLRDQRDSNAAIEAAKKHKAEILERLSVTEKVRWPTAFNEATATGEIPLGNAAESKLEKLVTTGVPTPVAGQAGVDISTLAKDLQRLSNDKSLTFFSHRPAMSVGDYTELAKQLARATNSPPASTPTECVGNNVEKACLQHHLKLTVAVYTEWPLATGNCPATAAPEGRTECVEQIARTEKLGIAGKREEPGQVQQARNKAYDEGIFVREPAQGKLVICRTALATNGVCKVEDDLAAIEPANFPQLGQLRFLRFNVPIFQAKDMGVFLTADGRVERYYMKSTKAALEAASASAANAASTIADALEKRETEQQSDLAYDQKKKGDALAAQITELENATKLAKLQQPPSTDPLKPVRDAAAENEAYIAQLQSQLIRQQLQAAIESQDDAAMRALLAILKGQ